MDKYGFEILSSVIDAMDIPEAKKTEAKLNLAKNRVNDDYLNRLVAKIGIDPSYLVLDKQTDAEFAKKQTAAIKAVARQNKEKDDKYRTQARRNLARKAKSEWYTKSGNLSKAGKAALEEEVHRIKTGYYGFVMDTDTCFVPCMEEKPNRAEELNKKVVGSGTSVTANTDGGIIYAGDKAEGLCDLVIVPINEEANAIDPHDGWFYENTNVNSVGYGWGRFAMRDIATNAVYKVSYWFPKQYREDVKRPDGTIYNPCALNAPLRILSYMTGYYLYADGKNVKGDQIDSCLNRYQLPRNDDGTGMSFKQIIAFWGDAGIVFHANIYKNDKGEFKVRFTNTLPAIADNKRLAEAESASDESIDDAQYNPNYRSHNDVNHDDRPTEREAIDNFDM